MQYARHLLFALLLLALLFSGQPVAACSCVYAPDQDHACVSFANTDAVFSGRVTSVAEVRNEAGAEIWEARFRVFRFAVLEGFSGVDTTMVEVKTGAGGGDCGFDFEVGRSYLVYARRQEDGTLSTGICSRTRPLEQAAADLDHARRVVRGEPQVRLFGKVEHVQRTGLDHIPTWEGLEGIQITAEGPGGERFSAISDADGRFEIRERLSGPYRVRAVLSEGLPPAATQEVVVPAGRCTGTVLQASVLGGIQGRVTEADGRPAQSLQLSLIPLRKDQPEIAESGAVHTLEDGRFTVQDVPPGDYLLAVNPQGPSLHGPPYPPAFYLTASALERALPITVRPSETVELLDFQLPPPLVERKLSGQVRWHDDQPAIGVRVRVLGPDGREAALGTLTDGTGRFQLNGYEGYRYQLAAEHRGRGWAAHSLPVEVEVGAENEPIDLQINRAGMAPAPFPCRP